jgi:hypothetical protein
MSEQQPPPSDRSRGITRRQVLIGGATAGALVAAGYGRFALGDTFEHHFAGVLGIELEPARQLLAIARERMGDRDYDVRAAAFLAATTLPGEVLVPESARREAVDSLLLPMIKQSTENYVAIGLQDTTAPACGGLLRA